MRRLLPLVALFLLCGFIFAPRGQAACTIDDEEEYAVLAAVLFPNEPDVPDKIETDERNAYLAPVTVSLNGFHWNSYRLQDETVREKASKEPDRFMIRIFT